MKRPAKKDVGKYVILKNKKIGRISEVDFQIINHKRLPVITVEIGNDIINEVYTIAGRCFNNPEYDMIQMMSKESLACLNQTMFN